MSDPSNRRIRRAFPPVAALALLALLAAPRVEAAQGLGSLVSPGPLSKAHAKWEGLDNCQKCHEPGKKVSSAKCLECHKPIAERIAAKKGVHRNAGKECVSCHVEHAGEGAAIRALDAKTFNHGGETGFELDGKHRKIDCAACHKTRSFLTLKPDCTSCHQDPHAGKLGTTCGTCHPATVPFKESRKVFDHAKSAYPLTGAHMKVACEKCHATKGYKGVRFAACTDCHKDPHSKPLGACATCHTTTSFRMAAGAGATGAAVTAGAAANGTETGAASAAPKKFDHAKTGYPLVGRHAALTCGSCHAQPATKVHPKFARCSNCHTDPHRGVFKSQDCSACHKETGWKGGTFDHTTTKFPLTGKHAPPLACAACHKGAAPQPGVALAKRTVDFQGARADCSSCHVDVHKGQLGARCETCHTPAAFKVTTYKHPRFPEFFGGQHAPVACEKCHAIEPGASPVAVGRGKTVPVRRFKNIALDCATCHKDPHLGQVSKDCASCHSIEAAKFAVPRFDHSKAKFALTGKHVGLDCAKCHKKEAGTFPAGSGTAVRLVGLATECASCHKDVHLGQLGTSCQTCHTSATFEVKSYQHKNPALKGFFTDKHATAECRACHKKADGTFPSGPGTAVRFTGLPAADCGRCHDDAHKGKLGSDCASCHTMSIWRTVNRAFHKGTNFPLEGQHLALKCASCHWEGVYKGTPNTCYDCHWIRRQDDLYRTALGTDCGQCHRPTSWTAVLWNHAAQTGFALSSAHASLRCDQCHKNRVFAGTPTDCFSCHAKDYQGARNPDHTAGGFPTTCTSCHRPGDPTWHLGTFNHTAFPLAGAHASTACANCHKNNNYTTVPTSPCSACHITDFQNSKNPPHVSAGFSTACDQCHKFSDATWQQATFNHSTVFPLAGAHATTPCANCHKNSNYKTVPTSPCSACHQTDFQNATTPVSHAGFPTACEQCHAFSDATWQQKTPFNHAAYFALAGTHATTACVNCHKNNNYATVPTSPCSGCHLTDFQNSKNPPHVSAGFPTTCDTCHKFSDPTWQQGTFASHTAAFPLTGAHLTTACANCHKNNNYTTVPKSPCTACHQTDFQNALSPVPHAGFPSACEQCHSFSDMTWQQKTPFNHTAYFALAGTHATTPCANCHKNNNYTTVPTSPCSSCHLQDYQTAITPVNHVASNFPTTCDSCHKFSDATWSLATFSHTTYPLSGAHATASCASCHKNNVYKGTTRDCGTCHQADFAAATTPVPHAGFPTACDQCHKFTDMTWSQKSSFNHSTYFALAGTHATTPCANCHKNNNYTTVPTSPCSSCHLQDYQTAITPVNHVASNFPTTCDTCHKFSDATWMLATFAHTTFPLAGAHATTACANCHKNNNYTTVPTSPCTACHQTDFQNATAPVPHAGFPSACEQCHKFSDNTWAQKSAFNHTTYFALAGTHATTPCANCHKNNNYTTVPTSPCSACHMTDYQNAISPVNHVASNFPTTCDTCHKFSDATWMLATFSHTIFPLAGAHATTACVNCHTNNNYTTVPTGPCSACHLTDFQNATTPVPHTGFSTSCDQCHRFSDNTWSQKSAFNHTTYFALAGTHATTPCANCHKNNNYLTVPTSPCTACHQTDFQNATSPVPHTGFPTACEQCHAFADATWQQKTPFNHATYFALAGAHATSPCTQCHNPPYAPSPNNYLTVPTSPCSACHQTDFQNATSPVPHTGFPTACDQCHKFTDNTWSQKSAFNHATYFPLAGAHATTTCVNCHKNGNYLTVPTAPCYACHQTDYQNAISPVNHIAAGFPTTCDTCHKFSDTLWSQAVFNHTWFPRNHGNSGGVCSRCHTNPSNYTVFSCTICHTAAQTNPHHNGVSGYVYQSSACYACHPNGGGNGPIRIRSRR